MKLFRHFAIAAVLMLCVSCRTGGHLPPVDFSAPGWQVRQGQGVWKPTKNRPELAGDLLLATNANGNFMIQFSKTPFTLATARIQNGTWQIEFGAKGFLWGGHGQPPARFVWFQLPRALAGQGPESHWKFDHRADDSWRLENSRTGETLEAVLFP